MYRQAPWLIAPWLIAPLAPLHASGTYSHGDAGAEPAQLCRAAIGATERMTGIPDEFLAAISRVESGRSDGVTLNPWPWTVNAAGEGHFYPTRQAAIDAAKAFLASGIRSLDVGCLQVNLMYHPDAFASLDQAFDPATNAAYAAKLLIALFQTTGSWPLAAAAYHSMTPSLGRAYQEKVLQAWATPDRPMLQPGRAARRDHPTPLIEPAAHAVAPVSLASTTPPLLGFNRRFMLPVGQPGIGRTLAAYRAATVQLAWRQPASPMRPFANARKE